MKELILKEIKFWKNLKKYWKSEIELTNSAQVDTLRQNEFVDTLPVDNILEDDNLQDNIHEENILQEKDNAKQPKKFGGTASQVGVGRKRAWIGKCK